jgi:hypothetical protein
MSYFLAASLVQLRNEINAAHPDRDKTSDGWIGDASHQARVSDHNPDYAAGGIVRAIDVDKDGIDTDRLLAVVTRDSRVEYVIWQRGIYERGNGFRRRAYTGVNPHDKHMHISIRHTATAAGGGEWGYKVSAASVQAPDPGLKSVTEVAREVIAGQWGNNPQRGQRLQAEGYSPTAVQAEVNRLMGGGGSAPTRLSIGILAEQVIALQWGVQPERERRITAAGYDYQAVQAEVNRRLG